ncbi:zeta toxin family protein [Streptomyces sp. NPDC006355]|uniref:zeta toxin family protein n=1 Tax=Streptomyces sp. NPDC006355 TaxID=3156758 RepID=UPI0033BA44DE
MAERNSGFAVRSEQESFDVLHRVILPAVRQSAVVQARPVVVVVAGQPGAGKTEIADLVQTVLDRRGGAVRVVGTCTSRFTVTTPTPWPAMSVRQDPGSAPTPLADRPPSKPMFARGATTPWWSRLSPARTTSAPPPTPTAPPATGSR